MIEEILSHHMLDHAFNLGLFGFSIPMTVHTVYMAGISIALTLLLITAAKTTRSKVRVLIEAYLIFVRDDIVRPNLGQHDKKLVPFFATMLIFLLFANYLGLFPGARTITANISITLGMAMVSAIMIMGLSVRENGPVGFFKTFVPGGVPAVFVPLLFPLEVVSLLIRVFVLAVRLFANMSAGHMVLLGLYCCIFIMGGKGLIAGYASALPVLAMTLFVTVLELLVAAIQAYVFTLLTAIFTGLQLHAH